MTLRQCIDTAYVLMVEEIQGAGVSLGEAIDRVEKAIAVPDPDRDRLEAEKQTADAHRSMHGVIVPPPGFVARKRRVSPA